MSYIIKRTDRDDNNIVAADIVDFDAALKIATKHFKNLETIIINHDTGRIVYTHESNVQVNVPVRAKHKLQLQKYAKMLNSLPDDMVAETYIIHPSDALALELDVLNLNLNHDD